MIIGVNPTALKFMRLVQINEEFEELNKQYKAAMAIEEEALEAGDAEKAMNYLGKAFDIVGKQMKLTEELKALGEIDE